MGNPRRKVFHSARNLRQEDDPKHTAGDTVEWIKTKNLKDQSKARPQCNCESLPRLWPFTSGVHPSECSLAKKNGQKKSGYRCAKRIETYPKRLSDFIANGTNFYQLLTSGACIPMQITNICFICLKNIYILQL